MKAENYLIIWDIVRNETGFAAVAELSCGGYPLAGRAASENVAELSREDGRLSVGSGRQVRDFYIEFRPLCHPYWMLAN
jgi:hypothetical protein